MPVSFELTCRKRLRHAVTWSLLPLGFCSCGQEPHPTPDAKSVSTAADSSPNRDQQNDAHSVATSETPAAVPAADSPRGEQTEKSTSPSTTSADKSTPVSKVEVSSASPAEATSQSKSPRPESTTDVDDERQRAVIERFVTVLESNPRRGTALDKIYGYHVERGSLDQFVTKYREAATAPVPSGKDALIWGLVESLRGQDAEAVRALEIAERSLPENPLVSFYLGQALVLVGRPDAAVLAFERAIERKPAQPDMLDVFQALGRVHQRAQRNDKALETWTRLETLYPNDARVQEQIATTLLEEGNYSAALPRFEALAKMTKDAYRQSVFRIEVAELRVRLGQNELAIADFEQLLSQLNPDNWLYREVRRKLEQVYLRTDDQAGLVTYYEGWLSRHAEDTDAMSRLARLLAGLGRASEAQKWLENGLKAAPRRKELRLALIDQLIYEQKFAEAAQQYAALDAIDPNHPDHLRDWGRLLLRDTNVPEVERKQAAASVWRRLTDAKPKDPLAAAQVADLFRQADMKEDALAMYQRAIELAPDSPQYFEYLGEYYHRLERRDDALSTWRKIVAGKNRTSANLGRLAEVLASFGYLAEAIELNSDACQLDKKDFSLWLKQADYLHQAERFDEALAQLTTAESLAINDEEREAVLVREIKSRQSNGSLKSRIEQLKNELSSK